MFRTKEALTIAGVTLGGFAIAVLVALAVSEIAGLWPRLLVAVLIVLCLVCFLFRGPGKPKLDRN